MPAARARADLRRRTRRRGRDESRGRADHAAIVRTRLARPGPAPLTVSGPAARHGRARGGRGRHRRWQACAAHAAARHRGARSAGRRRRGSAGNCRRATSGSAAVSWGREQVQSQPHGRAEPVSVFPLPLGHRKGPLLPRRVADGSRGVVVSGQRPRQACRLTSTSRTTCSIRFTSPHARGQGQPASGGGRWSTRRGPRPPHAATPASRGPHPNPDSPAQPGRDGSTGRTTDASATACAPSIYSSATGCWFERYQVTRK